MTHEKDLFPLSPPLLSLLQTNPFLSFFFSLPYSFLANTVFSVKQHVKGVY